MLEKILVIDDDSNIRSFLSDLLSEEKYTVLSVSTITQARESLRQETFDLILCDVNLQDGNGMTFLKELKEEWPQLRVIVITGFASLESMGEALRLGVMDYLNKPIDPAMLYAAVNRVKSMIQLEAENNYLRNEVNSFERPESILGESPAIKELNQLVERLGVSDATVLIQGESGTGKEVVARSLFEHSKRSTQPFIKVNCAAVAPTLLESEFFGHEKGSFTGAVERRLGRFELANGGTILLDEISEIPSELQVKLLRVLQEREFERVGGNKTIPVDVRIMATSNRNLLQEVAQGRFREDLFYRLNVVPIQLPPLRERDEDVLLLAGVFLKEFNRKYGKKISDFSSDAKVKLKMYTWPGNIRELRNVIEREVILAPDNQKLEIQQLKQQLVVETKTGEKKEFDTLDLSEIERRVIHDALKKFNGNRTHAAKALNISLRTLANKIALYRKEGSLAE